MSSCEEMQDRMPAVARGESTWTDTEILHLGDCVECGLEWRVIRGSLHAAEREQVAVDPDRVANAVLSRLRTAAPTPAPMRRLPWRAAAWSALAAAAAVVVVLGIPRKHASVLPVSADSAAVAVLPELQNLSDGELESVLSSLGPSAGDATPGVLPHLEDLTDSELEQLLRMQGGE